VEAPVNRVLIIDGDTAVGTAIKVWLEVEGADVTHIEDDPGGIEAMRNEEFDLVIIELSALNSLKTIKLLHQIRPNVPIIVLSNMSYRSDGVVDEAIAVGATRVFGKPFKPRDLMQAIEASLGGSLGERQSLRPEA
jgi:two-component system, OmpR family, response regulator ArlR